MFEELAKASFEPYLNTTFLIASQAGEDVPVELVEITDHSNEKVNSFSLVFSGSLEQELSQETYTLKHERMGEINLLLTPIVYGEEDTMYYEAVFSRLIE